MAGVSIINILIGIFGLVVFGVLAYSVILGTRGLFFTKNEKGELVLSRSGYIGIVILIFLALIIFVSIKLSKEPGLVFENGSDTTKYWVYLQPENAEAKNYRVQADIKRFVSDDSQHSAFLLDKVYWPNGGTSEFSGCDLIYIKSQKRYESGDTCATDENIEYEVRVDSKFEN